jgi:small subunit ribosomal protein S13
MFLLGVKLKNYKQLVIELSNIYGLGKSRSSFVCRQLGFGNDIRVKTLSRAQFFILKDFVLSIYSVDTERRLIIDESIEMLKQIGSYRGQRHTLKLPVRGQRTRSNHRSCKK